MESCAIEAGTAKLIARNTKTANQADFHCILSGGKIVGNLGTWTESVSQICCRIPGCTNYKAIPSPNFQNFGRVLLFFEFGGIVRGVGVCVSMGRDYNSAGADHGQFDKTRWSMVLEAVQSRVPGAPKALAELCGLYWRPLYGFARRLGRSPEDAQDLVQGFF
jgi:hypothetical protein